jgi:hypothetical protein
MAKKSALYSDFFRAEGQRASVVNGAVLPKKACSSGEASSWGGQAWSSALFCPRTLFSPRSESVLADERAGTAEGFRELEVMPVQFWHDWKWTVAL